MPSPLKTFIFIGRSGCGKGTQVELLKKYLTKQDSTPIFCIETGNRFRAFVEGKSHASQLANAIMKTGARQPDFLAVWMWSNVLIESFTGTEHLILDGTPRALAEAETLDTALEFFNREQVFVIHLNIPRAVAKERLLARGRHDDRDPAEVDKRLDWFDADVAPAVEFYRNHDSYKFIELDGTLSIEAIHSQLIAGI